MNSLVKVFSNFKEFYNEINGATLTGAIDVIVVEQPDGEFHCSPFHVRFGKLGVLRSREKVVDIMINGEPVDIHMKLGESGEAFFVEECPENCIDDLPDNLATSPIPINFLSNKFEDDALEDDSTDSKTKTASEDLLPLPLPRRNSIDFSKETAKEDTVPIALENQVSDYSHRRYTDNVLDRRNIGEKLKEYTTMKLRQEWAEHEEVFQLDVNDSNKPDNNNITIVVNEQPKEAITDQIEIVTTELQNGLEANGKPTEATANGLKEEGKGNKKKRRKKTQMKKKNAQRKSSSSSSIGSNITLGEAQTLQNDDADGISISISNHTNYSSTEHDSKSAEKPLTVGEESEHCQSSPLTPATRIPDLDIHFFSDTEVTSSGGNGTSAGRGIGRPSTPVQSDSELEISKREKEVDVDDMTSSASWKWGQLPTPEHKGKEAENGSAQDEQTQAQRRSMLSGMFNFMKRTNQIRKQGTDGGVYLSDLDAEGMDPEITAMYFPMSKENTPTLPLRELPDEDRESGNGTSLPHSPSSMEGAKSLDSDYEDGKAQDRKYLDFVAMSVCGGLEKGVPSDEEFDRHLVKYSDEAIAALMNNSKLEHESTSTEKPEDIEPNATVGGQTKRSWWYWRRSQTEVPNQANNTAQTSVDEEKDKSLGTLDEKDGEVTVQITQTSRPNTPDVSENTPSKTDSTMNAENTSAMVENLEDLSQLSNNSTQSRNKGERYKKSLRLSSEAIKHLNLREGMNEIEFSVTTAYQGTSRCKCYLFRWKHNDKVVISDIDGTITKSDVLGHLLPMVGKDWAQLGVAQLFSKIEQNGYKLLYLSARAIGQSRATREYLRSIRQGDVQLPDGPLLLNPTSLISAFHREVIERKPEQFKIACLTDIRDLFPDKNPFYAGYGNRINDVWAYRAVGIPIMRIFTINTKGELKHELTQTFQSSGYLNQSLEVDEYFPALETRDCDYSSEDFDDDAEEDELQFSLSDQEEAPEADEVFIDNFADDGIDLDESTHDALLVNKK